MRISFVLGPAGSGKTFRCLSEIRSALLASAEGAPLIFIAPKQSTFQIERQLLEGGIGGFSRLQIVSFERFARFIFQQLGARFPDFLSEQGRTMVLRALLTEMEQGLSIFRSAARRLGFAEEVSKQIREFQNHGLSAARVRNLANDVRDGHSAKEKLMDLALIYDRYTRRLAEQRLEDGDALLTGATELLKRIGGSKLEFGGIWFDGFAQLTPQELEFLVESLRFSRQATLAFCVDPEASADSKISAGYLVDKMAGRCTAALETRFGKNALNFEMLKRSDSRSRFSASAELRHLERCWQMTEPYSGELNSSVRIVRANDPEAEAIFVAREIVRHVRNGGRYRETALLLRSLQNDYAHVLRRVFRRYEIPYFLDHRESVAHHPAAELTRGALRTIAYNFQHHDWFATLKCGIIRGALEQLDELENEALARGWHGAVWRNGFKVPKDEIKEKRLNNLRERLVLPFVSLGSTLGGHPRAEQLVGGIRALWATLKVEEQLESWSQEDPGAAVHATVWDQMEGWLQDLERAFRGQQMSLTEWLPIVEAGLRNLTVGVVPPVLDQVLIGTVDRSRNPDLNTLYVLGLNERVFPAAPARDLLLSEDDREILCDAGCTMGETPAWRLAGEQFYGYIACTRPRERLVLSFCRSSADGGPLNPSRFISQVQRIMPAVKVEEFALPNSSNEVLHRCELAPLGLDIQEDAALATPNQDEKLDAEVAQRLYGPALHISVSSLERFAACPFKFFLEQGLRVKERKEFQLDVREQGSFQHDVLAKFHDDLKAEGLRWRDVTPAQARERVGRIADAIIPQFGDGLLASTKQNQFTASNYKRTLQDLIEVLVGWFSTNKFDPEVVEFGFGRDHPVPGWNLDLGNGFSVVLHGRVDRVDIYRISETEALCVVMDYKSGLKKPSRTMLHHGIQQQLPAYLLTMTRVREVAAHFKVERILPAGCFLLPLSGRVKKTTTRRKALEDVEQTRRSGYTHEGIYDLACLEYLDAKAPKEKSGQFNHRISASTGLPHGNTFNALKTEEFTAILARSEELIRETGQRIFAGEIGIHPYKSGSDTACSRCDYQSVCRFDPWTQKYNVLAAPKKGAA